MARAINKVVHAGENQGDYRDMKGIGKQQAGREMLV